MPRAPDSILRIIANNGGITLDALKVTADRSTRHPHLLLVGDRVTFMRPQPPRPPKPDDALVPLGEEAVVVGFGIRVVPRQFPQGPLAPGFYLDIQMGSPGGSA